jgi:hypothetical protein
VATVFLSVRLGLAEKSKRRIEMEASVSYHGYFRRLVGRLHLARTVVQSRRPVLWRVIPPHDEFGLSGRGYSANL